MRARILGGWARFGHGPVTPRYGPFSPAGAQIVAALTQAGPDGMAKYGPGHRLAFDARALRALERAGIVESYVVEHVDDRGYESVELRVRLIQQQLATSKTVTRPGRPTLTVIKGGRE